MRVFVADSNRFVLQTLLGRGMGPGHQDSLRGKAAAHLGSGMTRRGIPFPHI